MFLLALNKETTLRVITYGLMHCTFLVCVPLYLSLLNNFNKMKILALKFRCVLFTSLFREMRSS